MTAINRGFFIPRSSLRCSWLWRFAAANAHHRPQGRGRFAPNRSRMTSFNPRWLMIGSVLIGILLAAAMQVLTGYFTETNRKPVDDVAQSSPTGPATVIPRGYLAFGICRLPALVIAAAVYGAFFARRRLAGVQPVRDRTCRYGSVDHRRRDRRDGHVRTDLDNAQGIAEMSGDVDEQGAQVLTNPDAVGNTTKAITTNRNQDATAVLAATALFGSFL